MSNIGEAQITRLTRERLAAIKKFLPVRDSFRDNLQAQQQSRMDFTTDTQRLFTPITTAIEKSTPEIVTAIEKSKPEVASVIEKSKPEVKPVKIVDNKVKQLRERFEESFLTEVDSKKLSDLPGFAATGYFNKEKYLKPRHLDYIKNPGDFAKAVYKVKNEISQVKYDDPIYQSFLNNTEALYLEHEKQMIKARFERQQRKKRQKQTTPARGRPKRQQDPDPLEEEITGQGYKNSKNHTSIPCSRNILDDVSRLEVLIGGKRAGNNSPQITNEATEICQRLFQGKVIGMGLYRDLVNELIDVDYYSD